MNIFLHELKEHRKSTMIWLVSVFLMLILGMTKYGGYSSAGESATAAIDKFPRIIKVLFGIGDLDMSTASGYYGVLLFYIIFMAIIHAGLLGAHVIAKEEIDKTVEFLFVKPVKRTTVILYKLLAALVNIILFNLMAYLGTFVLTRLYDFSDLPTIDIVKMFSGILILQLLFMTIGSAVAAIRKGRKSPAGIMTAIILGVYFLSIAISLNEKLDFLKIISPFHYFEPATIINGKDFSLIYFVISFCVIIGSLIITFTAYQKRDLQT